MKATKEGAFRRRRDKAFRRTVPSCFGRAAHEFFLRCFASHSRCHHLDVFALSAHAIADVCVRKENTFFFSKRSVRYYELLAFD
jgi:hypothetical protein